MSGSMWQMWCRLISRDCWQAAGNSLLWSKSSGKSLRGAGGRPKIISLDLITPAPADWRTERQNEMKNSSWNFEILSSRVRLKAEKWESGETALGTTHSIPAIYHK